MPRSTFGVQAYSTRRSSPAHGFGSSTRTHASKIYAGSEHAKSSSSPVSPGPCYELGPSCGAQFSTRASSPAMWQFGTAQRFGQRASGKGLVPGPGAYDNMGAFGRQGLSNRSTFPRYGFGTVDRDMAAKVFISPSHAQSNFGHASPGPAAMYAKEGGLAGRRYGFGTDQRFNRLAKELGDASELPGPGSYDDRGTLGGQHSSRLVNEPAFGFGSSTRDHSSRVFVSSLHSKASGSGARSPGPSAYGPVSSMGAQASTRGRSAPGWGFGKATRFKAGEHDTGGPGPGAYST